MNKYLLITLILFPMMYSCKEKQVQKSIQTTRKETQIEVNVNFKLPEIPAMLTSPEQKNDYLANHFWDNYNFSDSLSTGNREITEQIWVDYLALLNQVPLKSAQKALKAFIIKTGNQNKTTLNHFTRLAEKYLYDPNSPNRNEELYIPVLEAMCETPALTATDKIRPLERLKLAYRNRPGTKAIDFNYSTLKGLGSSLYKLKAEYTLLFFNNPGCHACDEYIKSIKESAIINKLQENGRLKVLSIYPDEDLTEWKTHYTDFPAQWINGYDKRATIKRLGTYDLKAIPTLYLLDKNKTVLLKDAVIFAIEDYLKGV